MNLMGISIEHIRNGYLKVINYGIYHGNGQLCTKRYFCTRVKKVKERKKKDKLTKKTKLVKEEKKVINRG